MKVTLFVLILFLPGIASAESVYKSTETSGVPMYTSKPKGSEAKPADLPPIMKAEVKLSDKELSTCTNHGGINCKAGPDEDGSVVCYDGFKAAVTRYRFSCTTPKLEITEISELTREGTFKVVVRNLQAIDAKTPKITFKPDTSTETVTLKGPDLIEAYGVGEFIYSPYADIKLYKSPDAGLLDITCANCP